MDMPWLSCLVATVCVWLTSAERHSVFWNSTNQKFERGDYAVEVRLNDYLDIVCPHYPLGEVPSQDAERYVLYMVDRDDYEECRPQSYEQLRWECDHPFAAHAPEKFSEKFQRFTPFTLGKEFRPGESYYYISKPLHHHGQECLKLRVDVVTSDGSQEAKFGAGRGTKAGTGGGTHTTSNSLPADDPVLDLPEVQKSVRKSSASIAAPWPAFGALLSVLLMLLLQ